MSIVSENAKRSKKRSATRDLFVTKIIKGRDQFTRPYFNIDILPRTKSVSLDIKCHGETFKLPFQLIDLRDEIEKSKYLLTLEEDWDDEGGRPVSFDTWKAGINLLIENISYIFQKTGIILDTPKINPGPEDSIDLLWRNEKYRLLINVPSNLDRQIECYGDDNSGGNSIKVKFKPSSLQRSWVVWLADIMQ